MHETILTRLLLSAAAAAVGSMHHMEVGGGAVRHVGLQGPLLEPQGAHPLAAGQH